MFYLLFLDLLFVQNLSLKHAFIPKHNLFLILSHFHKQKTRIIKSNTNLTILGHHF